jgi:hypothetical protein
VERANAEVLRGILTRTFDRFKTSGRNWIAPHGTVGSANYTKPSHWQDAFLARLRGGGRRAHGAQVWITAVRAYDDTIQCVESIDDVTSNVK